MRSERPGRPARVVRRGVALRVCGQQGAPEMKLEVGGQRSALEMWSERPGRPERVVRRGAALRVGGQRGAPEMKSDVVG